MPHYFIQIMHQICKTYPWVMIDSLTSHTTILIAQYSGIENLVNFWKPICPYMILSPLNYYKYFCATVLTELLCIINSSKSHPTTA